jgi:hypothetical protein
VHGVPFRGRKFANWRGDFICTRTIMAHNFGGIADEQAAGTKLEWLKDGGQ